MQAHVDRLHTLLQPPSGFILHLLAVRYSFNCCFLFLGLCLLPVERSGATTGAIWAFVGMELEKIKVSLFKLTLSKFHDMMGDRDLEIQLLYCHINTNKKTYEIMNHP
jgi:hypothetical protein